MVGDAEVEVVVIVVVVVVVVEVVVFSDAAGRTKLSGPFRNSSGSAASSPGMAL